MKYVLLLFVCAICSCAPEFDNPPFVVVGNADHITKIDGLNSYLSKEDNVYVCKELYNVGDTIWAAPNYVKR